MNKNIELARTASSWVGRRITVFYLDAEGQSFPSGMGATITQDDDEYAIICEARLDNGKSVELNAKTDEFELAC